MSLQQILQALNSLPQIVEAIKKMSEQDKEEFIHKLGLQGEERAHALCVLNRFQKGEALTKEEQNAAQNLFLKALEMNNLELLDLLKIQMT